VPCPVVSVVPSTQLNSPPRSMSSECVPRIQRRSWLKGPLSSRLAESEGAYILTISRVPSIAVIAPPEDSLTMFVMVRVSHTNMAVPRRSVPVLSWAWLLGKSRIRGCVTYCSRRISKSCARMRDSDIVIRVADSSPLIFKVAIVKVSIDWKSGRVNLRELVFAFRDWDNPVPRAFPVVEMSLLLSSRCFFVWFYPVPNVCFGFKVSRVAACASEVTQSLSF
jgi:hypothetical protein